MSDESYFSRAAHRASLVILLAPCLLLGSCQRSRSFTGSSEQQTLISPDPSLKDIVISCEDEINPDFDLSFARSAQSYQYLLSTHCPPRAKPDERVNVSRPLDLVFVLDITKSMTPVLEAIKRSAVDLAHQLASEGWQARFAGVGFADIGPRFNFSYIDFVEAGEFERSLSQWEMLDGEDEQEAGLSALSYALERIVYRARLLEESRSTLLIYTSDAIAYDTSRDNFSTDALLRQFEAYRGELPKLSFFYATPKRDDKPELSPYRQMQRMTEKLGIPSKGLAFPLLDDVISDLKIDTAWRKERSKESCQIHRVILKSLGEKGVASTDSKVDGELLAEGKALVFATSPDPTVDRYRMHIRRCCTMDGLLDANCERKQDTTIKLRFSQSL